MVAGAGPAGAATTATPTAPPPVTVLTRGADNHNGDIFITPTGATTTYANGPEIIDNRGHVVWFHAVPQGLTASDFRVQRYLGRPVLTWWQGTGLGGLSSGTDYIYNQHYKQIATVSAGNGYSADGHEFLITPWNTALILSFTTATADLTSIGGPANQTVIDGIVQEINIRTGKVVFQWNSADHVPYSQSEQPLPASASTPWASDNQPEGLTAASQGNAQTTANGDMFVGWGNLPYISEFSPSGQLLFNAEFPTGVNTYRAYRLPWDPERPHR